MRRKTKALLVLTGLLTLLLSVSAFAATVRYTYDNLNRLIKVEHSNGMTVEYSYDDAGNRTRMVRVIFTSCPECSGDQVNLTDVKFESGTTCECRAGTSITLGSGVTIERGANIIFKAPTVNLQSGFHAEEGAVVNIKHQ